MSEYEGKYNERLKRENEQLRARVVELEREPVVTCYLCNCVMDSCDGGEAFKCLDCDVVVTIIRPPEATSDSAGGGV